MSARHGNGSHKTWGLVKVRQLLLLLRRLTDSTNAGAMAAVVVDAKNVAAAADAAANAKAENVAALVAAAVEENVALVGGEVERDGSNVATGESGGAIHGGSGGQRGGVAGKGVAMPIPVVDHIKDNSVCSTRIIKHLVVARPRI